MCSWVVDLAMTDPRVVVPRFTLSLLTPNFFPFHVSVLTTAGEESSSDMLGTGNVVFWGQKLSFSLHCQQLLWVKPFRSVVLLIPSCCHAALVTDPAPETPV